MTTIYLRKDTNLPERHINDVYRTEINLIRAALTRYAPSWTRTVLDIGAGDGRWGQIAREMTEARFVAGVEIEDQPCPEGFNDWHCPQDFLTWKTGRRFHLICGNPPYYCAEQIIRRAWDMLEENGRMIMLLRLAFQAGVDRYHGLWKDLPLAELAVCSRRPSFYGGGTNGTDYAIFFWAKTEYGDPAGTPRRWPTTLLYHERDKVNVQ